MDELMVASHGGEERMIRQFLARYDAPAYVRRALRVQQEYEFLIERCRRQREAWLPVVRTQLGLLGARASNWAALLPWLENGVQIGVLHDLCEMLQPRLRVRIEATDRARVLKRELRLLVECIQRFNRRWHDFVQGVNLSSVNEEREAYNRYYLLEKECAMRSARLARAGFCRLEPVTAADLARLLPPLPVPRLKQ